MIYMLYSFSTKKLTFQLKEPQKPKKCQNHTHQRLNKYHDLHSIDLKWFLPLISLKNCQFSYFEVHCQTRYQRMSPCPDLIVTSNWLFFLTIIKKWAFKFVTKNMVGKRGRGTSGILFTSLGLHTISQNQPTRSGYQK